MSTYTAVEQATPSTPSANQQVLYPKVGGWFFKNAAGVEQAFQSSINWWCGTSGGSANAQTLTPSPAIVSYAAAVGQEFAFVAGFTNTTAMTIAISGLAALNTTMGIIALPAGGVAIGRIYVALIESATSIRVAPYDTSSVDGDTFNGTIQTATGTTTIAPINMPAGVVKTSLQAIGDVEFDGVARYFTNDLTNGRGFDDRWQLFRLAANGSASNPIQDFFGANDGIPMIASAVYEIEWHCFFAIAALGGTVTWTLTNTGTLTNMVANYQAVSAAAGLAAIGTSRAAGVVTSTTATQALPVSDTLTITTNHYHIVRALIEQNGAGNLRLRITCGATTTALPLRGSYFKVRRLPAGNTGTFVA